MNSCPSLHGARRLWGVAVAVLFACILATTQTVQAKPYGEIEQQRIDSVFPQADAPSEPQGEFNVRTLSSGDKVLGYVFQSLDVIDIPAYSGKPINMQVILDTAGVIQDAYVLEHHEPILLIGIPEAKLHAFNAKYKGIKVNQRVVVGRSSDPNAVTVDAVTGATVTVMVVNEVVMRAAHTVAVSLGLVADDAGLTQKPATLREDIYQPADWTQLTGNGAIRRLHLTRGQVDEAFKGSEAEGVEVAAPEQVDDLERRLQAGEFDLVAVGRAMLAGRPDTVSVSLASASTRVKRDSYRARPVIAPARPASAVTLPDSAPRSGWRMCCRSSTPARRPCACGPRS